MSVTACVQLHQHQNCLLEETRPKVGMNVWGVEYEDYGIWGNERELFILAFGF